MLQLRSSHADSCDIELYLCPVILPYISNTVECIYIINGKVSQLDASNYSYATFHGSLTLPSSLGSYVSWFHEFALLLEMYLIIKHHMYNDFV